MTGARNTLWIVAGGTGGHVFPAIALARHAMAQGKPVRFFTDKRGMKFQPHLPECPFEQVASGSPGGGFVKTSRALALLATGFIQSLVAIAAQRPACVVGFGGYPSVPVVLAAQLLGVRTVVHESNAVMGLANRFLARRARWIALSFAPAGPPSPRMVLTGNPVRADIAALGEVPYARNVTGPLNILVVGGSLGAGVFSDTVPRALQRLPAGLQKTINILAQVRHEDRTQAQNLYAATSCHFTLLPFIDDMAAALAGCHLVIGRAGGSTIAELATAGRPSILVPLRLHSDAQQTHNARALADAGGAVMIDQNHFTPEKLAETLQDLLKVPEQLDAMSRAARTLSSAHATALLLDLALPQGKP